MTVHVTQPKSSYDKECIYRFLYEIWADEFCRTMDGMDHENRWMRDALDETAQHLIAVDRSGRILGCVRANVLESTALPESLNINLQAAGLSELFGGERIRYASHFAVAPDARGRTVASLLIAALYRHCLNDGALVGISYCALQYVSFYSQLGYRPYTENFRLDAGVRVPIVHCLRDLGYLEEIKSPLARFCSGQLDDKGAAAELITGQFPAFRVPGFSRSKVHHLWARLAHATPSDGSVGKESFLTGLSEDERRIVSHRLAEMTFSRGEYLYRHGETELWIGVLLSGSLGVEVIVDGVSRIVNVIQPGQPFGEIGSFGGKRRSAALVALEDSQAFLFPFDFLERVGRADTGLGLKLAKRRLKILADRYVDLAEVVAGGVGSAAGSVRVKRPSLYLRADRCCFLKGTGDRIPLEDGAVDFSYARLLFQHLPNPLQVLGEMRRVTRRGGIAVIFDVDDRTNIVHPAPEELLSLEERIAAAQAAAGAATAMSAASCWAICTRPVCRKSASSPSR